MAFSIKRSCNHLVIICEFVELTVYRLVDGEWVALEPAAILKEKNE
jgi:hypothetical protein